MSGEKVYYYNVSLNLPATWSENVFTYKSEVQIDTGAVISVPFGNQIKTGVVVAKTIKPKMKAKQIVSIHGVKLPKQSLKLLEWINEFYPKTPGLHTQHAIPKFVDKLKLETVKNMPTQWPETKSPLTKLQVKAVRDLSSNTKPSVLYGVTGSGKTRVYSELAKQVLSSGKNVLVLYPEISLTAQTELELSKYLPAGLINTYHSKQTPKQQKETWTRALTTTQGRVFIGPRSALFLPYSNLGLIVVDEAHENSYKQDTGSRYHGLMVAARLAAIHNAKIILGSATPPVNETALIASKKGQIVKLEETAIKSNSDKSVQIVDMRNKSNLSKHYPLSNQLIASVKESLNGNKQSMIFLNRRGTFRTILCEECGYALLCDNCDLPMTLHHDKYEANCHQCGNKKRINTTCPDCSHDLIFRTPGIKAIEEEARKVFPGAVIKRFDSDNLKKDTLHENYEDILKGKVDILIGTQLITKGLDIPQLETVGILNADTSLMLPDYTSEEKAFQQLTQVSGRVGRGHTRGKVILQTHQPDNPVLRYIDAQDWPNFYKNELIKRKQNGLPPYSYSMKIWTSRATNESARSHLNKSILNIEGGVKILGPAPSFYEKTNGKYNWKAILLSSSRQALTKVAQNLPKDVYFDLEPVNFL